MDAKLLAVQPLPGISRIHLLTCFEDSTQQRPVFVVDLMPESGPETQAQNLHIRGDSSTIGAFMRAASLAAGVLYRWNQLRAVPCPDHDHDYAACIMADFIAAARFRPAGVQGASMRQGPDGPWITPPPVPPRQGGR